MPCGNSADTYFHNDNLMAITVEELLADSSLNLTLIHGAGRGALDHRIVWCHPTEVLDAAWSEPGEILITCGMNIPFEHDDSSEERLLLRKALKAFGLSPRHNDAEKSYQDMWDCYISQLSQAGVLAFGFGLGIKHPSTPKALIEAAKKNDMVLFEIPLNTPFASVSKAVSQSLTNENDNLTRRTYAAQRNVIHALSSPMPIGSVIDTVSSLINGCVAFVDTSSSAEGEIIAISHKDFESPARAWALKMARKRERSTEPWRIKTIFGLENDRDYCVCVVQNPQLLRQPPFGVIVASIPQLEESDMFFRSIAMSAADVLAVTLPRITVNDEHMRHLRSIAMAGLAQGQSHLALLMAHELWSMIPSPPLVLICLDGEKSALEHHYAMLSAAEKGGKTKSNFVFGEYGGRLWVVAAEDDRDMLARMLDREKNLKYGMMPSSAWESLDESFPEAIQDMNMRKIRQDGRSVVDMSPHELVLPQLASAYAFELFRPLQELPADESELLMKTIREVVSCSFNVGLSARRLDVHRHTIENRIAKVEQLIGLDLSLESDRVKIYIALAFIRNAM